MAYPTPDNGPVIDAGSQPNPEGTLYQNRAHATGNEAEKATELQGQEQNDINQEATNDAVDLLLGIDVENDMDVPRPPAAGE